MPPAEGNRVPCAVTCGILPTMSDDAPTTGSRPANPPATATRGQVVVLNRDLFFGVRIADMLRTVGFAVAIVPTTGAFLDRLRTAAPPAVLGIVDLGAKPEWELLRPLLAEPDLATPILAFGPHKDVAAMRAAKTAGVTRLISNGEFHRNLLGLVERYARPAEHSS
jgi:hypothetical protein